MEKLLDDLSERTSVAEKVVNFLRGGFSEIKSRERNLDEARESVVERMMEVEILRESYEKGMKDLEGRESDFREFREGKKRKLALEEEELGAKWEEILNGVRMKEDKLDEQLMSLQEQFKRLEAVQKSMQRRTREKLKEIEAQEQYLSSGRKSLAEKESKLEQIVETLDDRIRAVEERESKFDQNVDRKMKELALKEEQLTLKWQEFAKEVRLADERFMEHEKVRIGLCQRLGSAENKVEGFSAIIDERFKQIESRQSMVRESVADNVKQADLIRELLEKEVGELEKMKASFFSFQEVKTHELLLKEEQLDAMSRDLAHNIELMNEQLTKRGNQLLGSLELAQDKVESIEVMVDKMLKQIGLKEIDHILVNGCVEKNMDYVGSKEMDLKHFETMKRECQSFQEEKMPGLIWMENQLNVRSEELLRDAKLTDEQLSNQEKLGHQFLESLESAYHKIEDLRKTLHERVKEVTSKEIEVASTCSWVEKKMNEVDSQTIKMNEKEKSFLIEEKNLVLKQTTLLEKQKELSRQGKKLKSWQSELKATRVEIDSDRESNKKLSELLDRREKAIDSLKQFIHNCFREHRTIKKKLLLEKELVEKRARDLDLRESADIIFILRMDGKTLQMFLNDREKDLESMGDEIFKVLHLSSDPAKLVLDAMVGFYPPHLRKGDVETSVRRACISLLEQLFRMCKNIQPCTRKEAIELARSWKLQMRVNGENPLEVLGFLFLLAAYDVASCFDKNEISSFLMMVEQHRQRPGLSCGLGCTETSTDETVERREQKRG